MLNRWLYIYDKFMQYLNTSFAWLIKNMVFYMRILLLRYNFCLNKKKIKGWFTSTFIDPSRWTDAVHVFLIPNKSSSTRHVEDLTEFITLPELAFVFPVRVVKVHTIANWKKWECTDTWISTLSIHRFAFYTLDVTSHVIHCLTVLHLGKDLPSSRQRQCFSS